MPALVTRPPLAESLDHLSRRDAARAVLRGENHVDLTAQDLVLLPAQDVAGAGVPAGDPALQVEREDGVLGGALKDEVEPPLAPAQCVNFLLSRLQGRSRLIAFQAEPGKLPLKDRHPLRERGTFSILATDLACAVIGHGMRLLQLRGAVPWRHDQGDVPQQQMNKTARSVAELLRSLQCGRSYHAKSFFITRFDS